MKILFLHGLESKPGGPKPTFLANYGYDIVEPALPKDNWNASVKIARETFKQERPDAVVGSFARGRSSNCCRFAYSKTCFNCAGMGENIVRVAQSRQQQLFFILPTII